MNAPDAALEWNRLTEIYRQKSDDELEIIAGDAFDLTDIAQQVLASEIALRKLPVKLNVEAPGIEDDEEDFGPVDGVDADALDLRPVWAVHSSEELAAAKKAFEDAGIASFIGDQHVQEISDFHGNFKDGIELFVRYVDLGRASYVTQNYLPKDDSKPEKVTEGQDEPVATCPECHSDEVVFVSRDVYDKTKFRWRCDACGHKWLDDGLIR